jgi:hypothetical protein
VLRGALTIAGHDAALVTAKLARALDGQDRHEHDGDGEDHPIQNDWNGSARVALISLERSETAWRVVAQLTGEVTPALLATQLRDLRHEVEHVFPNAALFIRPGFDQSAL